MKEIQLYTILCGSEEEEYVYYFDGEKSGEEFENDVRDCVRKILNEKYRFEKVDENTYVKVSALNNPIVYEFIKWLRDDFGYDGEIWIDIGASGSIYFSTSDLEYDIAIYNASKNTKFRTLLNQFIRVIKPSEVIGSEDFINCMEKKGWEYVEIIDKEEVFFYEWGGFIQGDDGKWYNNVWNEGYKEI